MIKIIAITIVAASVAAGGYAQEQREGLRDRDRALDAEKKIATDLRTSTFHYGPWYLRSEIRLADIGIEEQYFVPAGESGGGLSLGLAAPQRVYFVPMKKLLFSANVTPSYTWASQSGSHTQGGYNARADMHLLFNHLYLDFFTGKADELRALAGEINSLGTVRSSESGVAGELKYSSKTSATFSAVTSRLRHPQTRLQPEEFADRIPQLDRDQDGYRVSLVHKTFPLTTFLLTGERSDYTFPGAPQKDSVRHMLSGGLIHESGLNTVKVNAGRARLEFDRHSQEPFNGLVGEASFERKNGRWLYSATSQRDLDFSIFEKNNFYVVERLGGEIGYSATRRLKLHVLTRDGFDRYAVPVGGIRRRDAIVYHAVGWDYALRRVSGGFDVGYYARTSNTPLVEERNGIRMTLRLSFRPSAK
jgi:hypothetical protein